MRNKIKKLGMLIIILSIFCTKSNADNIKESNVITLENNIATLSYAENIIMERQILEYNEENKEILIELKVYNNDKKSFYNLEIREYLTEIVIDNFNIEIEQSPSIGQESLEKINEKQILWNIAELKSGETSNFIYKMKLKEDSDEKILEINGKLEIKGDFPLIERTKIIENGKAADIIGGELVSYYKEYEEEIEYSTYEQREDYIYMEQQNNSKRGSILGYSGKLPIDVTNYKELVVKLRVEAELIRDGLKGFHANAFLGLQETLGDYNNFIGPRYFWGNGEGQLEETYRDSGIITNVQNIEDITGNVYFVINLMDCGGNTKIYLYDAYLQNYTEEYKNETISTEYKAKIKIQGKEEIKEELVEDKTMAETQLPNTGNKRNILALGILCVVTLYLANKVNKNKDIK